jgi:hypothetical protein
MNDEIKDTPETAPEPEKADEERKSCDYVELTTCARNGRSHRRAARRPVEDLPTRSVTSSRARRASSADRVERKFSSRRGTPDPGHRHGNHAAGIRKGRAPIKLLQLRWAKTPSATRSARWRPSLEPEKAKQDLNIFSNLRVTEFAPSRRPAGHVVVDIEIETRSS